MGPACLKRSHATGLPGSFLGVTTTVISCRSSELARAGSWTDTWTVCDGGGPSGVKPLSSFSVYDFSRGV